MAPSPEPPPPTQAPSQLFRLAPWVLLAVSALAAAALDRELRPVWSRNHRAYAGAEWIWDQGSTREVLPRAFYLVQDFDLGRELTAAWLSVLGDEEYLVYVNGVLVGSNRYRSEAKIDRYQVAARLRVGGNRLIVEVRSGRGTGGLLLSLEGAPDSPPLVVSDGAWRVFRGPQRGLFAGWTGLENGELAKSWGAPALGRWGHPELGEPRPLFPAHQAAEKLGLSAATVRMEWPRTGPPGGSTQFRAALFDFGTAQLGYFGLAFDAPAVEAGLVWLGSEPPRAEDTPADVAILLPPGARTWRDPALRRFRYALVLTPSNLEAAERVVIAAAEAAALPLPQPEVVGAFGVRPPPRLPPLEVEIRRQLPRELEIPRRP